MAHLTPRSYSIATILIKREQPITIKQLAEALSVSERTIRYDLDILREWMKERQVTLVKKSRVGVFIERNSPAFKALEEYFIHPVAKQQVYSTAERQFILADKILAGDKAYTIAKLAQEVNISKSTAARDLEDIAELIARHDLELIRKTNYGVELRGKEDGRRKALSEIIISTYGYNTLLQLINARDAVALRRTVQGNRIGDYLRSMPVALLRRCMAQLQHLLGRAFTDRALAELFVQLDIVFRRIAEGNPVNISLKCKNGILGSEEFLAVQGMMSIASKDIRLEISDDEVAYFTMFVLGAGVNSVSPSSDNALSRNMQDKRKVLEGFIAMVSGQHGTDFSADGELLEDLMLEIRPWISSAHFQTGLRGSSRSARYADEYSDVYEAVTKCVPWLEGELDVELNEGMAVNLTIHFAAALERQSVEDTYQYITAVVVCGAGVGTAKLLSSRIAKEFSQIKVLRLLSLSDFRDFDPSSVDMVFTTIPLDREGSNIILVDPLLAGESRKNIAAFLGKRFEGTENRERHLSRIMMIIENHCTIENRAMLVRDLERFLYMKEPIASSHPSGGATISSMITRKTVAIDAVATDYREAIRIGGRLLVDCDMVNEQYVEDMVESAERFKSNIVIAPHIALPHAPSRGNVKEACMSMVLLKEPVHFGHPANDPVKMLVCLGTVDEHFHEKALYEFLTILESPSLTERLFNARDVDEALLVINHVH